MFKDLGQKDERWADNFIGKSKAKMKDYGCCICSLSMMMGELRGYPCSPIDASKYWKFTTDGSIYWTTKFKGVEFVTRGYVYPVTIASILLDKDMGMVLEIERRGWSQKHWVYPRYIRDGRIYVSDPWIGRTIALPDSDKITGYASFKKAGVEIKEPDWIADEPTLEERLTALEKRVDELELSLNK